MEIFFERRFGAAWITVLTRCNLFESASPKERLHALLYQTKIRVMIRTPVFTLLPATLILAACGEAPAPGSEALGEAVEITTSGAWVRNPPGGRDVTAGFITITTNFNTELVAATSDEAARIELHTMSMEDGVMRMRAVTGFEITAGEPLHLASGGNHLMIFGLADDALDDGALSIDLQFTDGQSLAVDLPATDGAPG